MASIPHSAWIQLYKNLKRAAAQFPQYSYREFFKRRIREHFSAAAAADTKLSAEEFYKKEEELLKVIRRQVAVSHLYPGNRTVVETEEQKGGLN